MTEDSILSLENYILSLDPTALGYLDVQTDDTGHIELLSHEAALFVATN